MVIGAACQNPYWLQLKATILNREIVACKIPEAVSRGAALLGARGAGYEPEERALPAGRWFAICPTKKPQRGLAPFITSSISTSTRPKSRLKIR